jgi:hypothetical protein
MGGSHVRKRLLTGAAPTVPAEALFAAANRGAVAAKALSTSRREPPRDVSWYAAAVLRVAASTQSRAARRENLIRTCKFDARDDFTQLRAKKTLGPTRVHPIASPKGGPVKMHAFDERCRHIIHSRPKLVLRRVVRLHGTPVHRIVHHGRLRQEGWDWLGPRDQGWGAGCAGAAAHQAPGPS